MTICVRAHIRCRKAEDFCEWMLLFHLFAVLIKAAGLCRAASIVVFNWVASLPPLPIAASRKVKLGGTAAAVGFPDIGLHGLLIGRVVAAAPPILSWADPQAALPSEYLSAYFAVRVHTTGKGANALPRMGVLLVLSQFSNTPA